ncbi:chorismate-binding protein [Candidatus Margulisiibacteriota bacterium]
MIKQSLTWASPLSFARSLYQQKQDFILLYSSLNMGFSGNYSFLAFNPKNTISAENMDKLEALLTENKEKFENAWFGYLGYGLKNSLENLPQDSAPFIKMPDSLMINFGIIMVFDHLKKKCHVLAESQEELESNIPVSSPVIEENKVKIEFLSSNMSKNEYLKKVAMLLESIKNGDIYQANLTRKFLGNFKSRPNGFELFVKLCKLSPSPYSSYIKYKDFEIISSSPERFLTIDKDGQTESRPIKGSAKRYKDKSKDQQSYISLANSHKDKAENLMIVDLMRNDLSKTCIPSTIKVSDLFQISSYSTIHHMSSTLEPCPMCAGAMFQSRINRLVFGAKDLKWGAAGSVADLFSEKLFNHRIEVEYIKSKECESILREFFSTLRK